MKIYKCIERTEDETYVSYVFGAGLLTRYRKEGFFSTAIVKEIYPYQIPIDDFNRELLEDFRHTRDFEWKREYNVLVNFVRQEFFILEREQDNE
jgi:hypothetical protein